MQKILVFVSFLLVSACAGYVGWYFGHISGFEKAKAQYYPSIQNNNNANVSRKTAPKSSTKKSNRLPKYQYKDNSKSVKEAQRIINKANKIKRKQSNSTGKVASSKSKVIAEKSPICRWTIGRLIELERIINSGGRGVNSRFCAEYKQRDRELSSNHCLNSNKHKIKDPC